MYEIQHLDDILDIKSKSGINTCSSYHVVENSRLINPFGQQALLIRELLSACEKTVPLYLAVGRVQFS